MAQLPYPAGIDPERVSASAPVTGAANELLLLIHAGALVVLQRPRGGAFARLGLLGPRPLRLVGEVLRVSAAAGELVVPVPDWLELENVRRLLQELPAAQAPGPLEAARAQLLGELVWPHQVLLDTLDRRLADPVVPRRNAMPLDLLRLERELSQASAEELTRLAAHLRATWQLPQPARPVAPDEDARYTLTLQPYRGREKIMAIKALREVSDLGLADAKDLIEQGGVALRGLGPARVEEVRAPLEAAGAELVVTRE